MLGEGTPASMAMLVDVVEQELVLFRTPCPSFHSILVTTWHPSHLHQLASYHLIHKATHFADFNKLQPGPRIYVFPKLRETENLIKVMGYLSGIQRL